MEVCGFMFEAFWSLPVYGNVILTDITALGVIVALWIILDLS